MQLFVASEELASSDANGRILFHGKIIEEYPERDCPDIETCLNYATLPADIIMKCLKCFEGQPQIGVASLTYEREGSAIQVKVEGIPAEICPDCGEVYLSEAVAQQIHDLVSPLLEIGEEMTEDTVLLAPTVVIRFPPLEPASEG